MCASVCVLAGTGGLGWVCWGGACWCTRWQCEVIWLPSRGIFSRVKISQNVPWPDICSSYFRDVAIKDKYCAMLN